MQKEMNERMKIKKAQMKNEENYIFKNVVEKIGKYR